MIEEYQQQLAGALELILRSDIQRSKKMEFFGEVRHAVGRSALLLSGGGMMGMYHIGVVQTLIETDSLPKVIAGSSAGSIIASMLGTHSRDDIFNKDVFSFEAFIKNKKENLFRQVRRAGREGTVLDIRVLQQFLRDNIGEYTFQEAYDKFGTILNITVTGSTQHDSDRLLNYLTAPNVLIWSASAASCAIPYVYGAADLYCKNRLGNIEKYTLMNRKFLDGSIGQDLPMNQLSILFNVNNFIVSQTNPWAPLFMDYTEEMRGFNSFMTSPVLILAHRIKEFVLSEIRHRASQLAYVFPSAITKFFNLVTQSYVGDITIWPKPTLQDYRELLDNPQSFDMLARYVQGGKQRTFHKVHHIRSTMFMEKQIDKSYRKIKNASRMEFFLSNREIMDVEDEERMMKSVLEEEREWDSDDDLLDQSERGHRRLFKKVSLGEVGRRAMRRTSIEEKNVLVDSQKLQHRNDSFLLPRENSVVR